MIRLFYRKLILALLLTAGMATSVPLLRAQTPARSVAQDSTSKLKIETAERAEGFVKKGREIKKLSINVRLRQENTLIYCDTAIIDRDDAILRGNVVIAQSDSTRAFADSAVYFGNTRQSDLYGNVVLVDGTKQLHTPKLHYDLANDVASFKDGATLNNGKSQLTSKRGWYHTDTKDVFFKGDVRVADPDFTVRTDTMVFNTDTQVATFVAPTLISRTDSRIYCEGGFYDIEQDFAEFDVNPQYEREGQRGRARKMRYLGISDEYILEDSAYIEEKDRVVQADVIRHNNIDEKTTLIGNVVYKDSTQTITGEKLRYDSRSKAYTLLGRGTVSSPPNIIVADSLDFNDQLGNGFAQGAVSWQDTSSNLTIESFRVDYNKQTDYVYAFGGYQDGEGGRPLLKTLIDNDTLFMSADTLTSFRPDTTSDIRQILAHRDVRIFKFDLQAVCDSLSYSSKDSIFWFYKIKKLPVMWADTSQFSGDTIKMALKDSKLDRIWLLDKAMVVNSDDGKLFNQIKGNQVVTYFNNNQARQMWVDGNAEAIYYALDDKGAYLGVNQTAASEMRLYFGNNKVESIRFYDQPTGTFTPMRKAGKEQKKLDGFFWETQRRPRSVEDLLKAVEINR